MSALDGVLEVGDLVGELLDLLEAVTDRLRSLSTGSES